LVQASARGYQGGCSTLARHLRTVHAGTAPTAPAESPGPRRITGWIMQTRESVSPRGAAGLDEVRLMCPDIATACDFARTFSDLLRQCRGFLLHDWIRHGLPLLRKRVREVAGAQGSLGRSSLHGIGDDRCHELVDGCQVRWAGVAVREQEMPATDQREGE